MLDVRHNGIPMLGLGTFGRTGTAGLDAILTAIEIGYRHLDTAQSYDTEAVVGHALKRCGLPRGELFVTTKVRNENLPRERFLPSVRESLELLGVEQVDLLLIHWPAEKDVVPLEHYMEELVTAKQQGLAGQIGVSNFTIGLLERARAIIGDGQIIDNQVEVHPFMQNRKLASYCAQRGIAVTAYSPLAKGRAAADPTIRQIAEQADVPPSAVALAWLRQREIIAIPASATRANLEANAKSLKVDLTQTEMAAIDALERGERIIDPAKAPVWD